MTGIAVADVPEADVQDAAERDCTYVFPDTRYRCAELPSSEIHNSSFCEHGHPEEHHVYSGEPSDAR